MSTSIRRICNPRYREGWFIEKLWLAYRGGTVGNLWFGRSSERVTLCGESFWSKKRARHQRENNQKSGRSKLTRSHAEAVPGKSH